MNSVTTFPELKTDRLLLRQLKYEDNHELYLLRTDQKINQFIVRPTPQSIEEVNLFVDNIISGIHDGKWYYWAIEIKEIPGLIGTICLWNFTESEQTAEIGYELNNHQQGQGIMNEALSAVIKYAFKTLKLKAIEAYSHKENLSSTSLLMKNHFELTDKKDSENPNNIVYIRYNSFYQK